ncbi:class I SAM-dependent methyltransferase [Devosia sp. LjRoot3]|uniref:class I SAM-dependent methyltransferase n=1 Tax=Devosia sp. LjRoot3 TaxID=3342319 RepID=UPI003F500675
MPEATNWDAYYRATPAYTSLTRTISARKITGLFQQYGRITPSICELGGANSCFLDPLNTHIRPIRYHIEDLNEYGLTLLNSKKNTTNLSYQLSDILKDYHENTQFDIVYSVGLIEHFSHKDTRRAIRAHFERCKPGGIVLLTFPTPTPLYRTIRCGAEILGRWKFPDERPLQFDEVLSACIEQGNVVHRSVNWMIGLTQGYVLTRKT